ncbi:MAG: SET domain-containing protein-lysine N-methyltransferase [Blastocatellia bacterium]
MNRQEARRIVDVSERLTLFFNPANGNHSIRSSRPAPMNSALHTFGAREFVHRPTYLTVQVDDDRHILLAPEYLQYINHSCAPNVFFDTTSGEIIALRDIAANEEISFFYPSTEWTMTQPFDCFCGSANCLEQIRGAAHLSRKTLAKYRLADHIQHKLTQHKTTRELVFKTGLNYPTFA